MLNFLIDYCRNMVSNGEVIHSGATGGSSNIAEVVPSDLLVVFALYIFHVNLNGAN